MFAELSESKCDTQLFSLFLKRITLTPSCVTQTDCHLRYENWSFISSPLAIFIQLHLHICIRSSKVKTWNQLIINTPYKHISSSSFRLSFLLFTLNIIKMDLFTQMMMSYPASIDNSLSKYMHVTSIYVPIISTPVSAYRLPNHFHRNQSKFGQTVICIASKDKSLPGSLLTLRVH